MSETETTETGGVLWDAPNQQVVRADQSAPWDEGTGGEPDEPSPHATVETGAASPAADLDNMTKDELLELAQRLDVRPANASMSKGELREGIDAKLAEGGG